ncbi:coiled-coil domain-containing protein 86 [Marmota marmota marmota]|uniref:Coiled-coil domain-containing protein 86 n=1 Tax=Marmota marmota marmota TaxID=9994 RepID=A0A8C5YJJ4_MARMA|nr:coiled-coil domain-containing protein 86 [Marmota marmota marmota]
MDTPLRRSRRLEGLKPEAPGSLASVSRARRALVEVESNPEETREPGSTLNVQPLGLESPRRQRETSPGSPRLPGCADLESPRRQPELGPESPQYRQEPGLGTPQRQPEPGPESPQPRQEPGLGSPRRQSEPGPEPPQTQPELCPESPQHQQKPGLESPPRQPDSIPEFHQPQPKLSEESPNFPQDRGELDSEVAQCKEELAPGSPPHQLQPGSGSPEPYPGQQAPGPEPSQPLQELTPRAPDSPGNQQEPSKPLSSREKVTGGLSPKKRNGSSMQAPASKKLKKEQEELPVIPKGKPKSGRVWKDRSKKRFSQMVQDKPLRTSWQRKMKERQERKLTKDFARHLQEEKEKRRQEKKQRRAENLRRRLENERKAEVVQVIRNPAKLKRAKKKQLRSIQKRDTLALLQKQPPQRPGAKV